MTGRVVVTGLGWVSSLAPDAPGTWARMLAGASGLVPLAPGVDFGTPKAVAGAIPFEAPAPAGLRTTRTERLALQACAEALAGAGLDLERGDPRRRGVFQGASTNGLGLLENLVLDRAVGRRERAAEALLHSPARVGDLLAEAFRASGPRFAPMTACSASLLALGQAWERLAQGRLDAALVGGVETLCRTTWTGFGALKAMDAVPCRPFSRDRAGLNLGEAAVFFVLEPLELARARGASILGEVLGYGCTQDAHHATAPHPEGEGAARAMAGALRCAELPAEHVDLVSAHATATPANDGAECAALRAALGEAARRASLTASKSQFGHCLAAAGAVAASTALLALRDQVVSPTLRLEEPDPACGLDATPLVARERPLRAALVNAFAFGGHNVSLVLKAWRGR